MYATSSSSVSSLYGALCDAECPPAPVLRAAARHALAGDKVDILARLVSDPRCPDEVVAAIAERREARVRAAYLARPGLDAATLAAAVSSERRATVLAAAASADNAPPSLLEALSHDRRRAVAFAVATAKNTPEQARVRVLRALSERAESLGHAQRMALADAIEACPAIHDEHVTSGWSPAFDVRTRIASSPSLSAASLEALVASVLESLSEASSTSLMTWQRERKVRAAGLLARAVAANPALSDAHRRTLRDAIEAAGLPRGALADVVAVLDSPSSSDTSTLLRGLVTGDDVATLVEVVAELPYFDRKPLDPTLVAQLAESAARNPAAPPQTVAVALSQLQAPVARSVLEARSDDIEVLRASVLRSDGLRALAASVALQRPATAEALLRELCESAMGWTMCVGVREVLSQSGYAPELVAVLPVRHLGPLCVLEPDLASAVSAQLAAHLVDDVFTEVFNSLAEDFTGSLGELIDASSRLARMP